MTALLTRWKGRQIAFKQMMHRDYGDQSPEKNKVIMSMEWQLDACIQELENVMSGSWLTAALAKSIVKSNKKASEEKE